MIKSSVILQPGPASLSGGLDPLAASVIARSAAQPAAS